MSSKGKPHPPAAAGLFNPTRSLVIRFDHLSNLHVVRRVLKKKSKVYFYEETALDAITPVTTTMDFSLTVAGPAGDPAAAMVVNRYGDWDFVPWAEELAFVLGGLRFPFGSDPDPISVGAFNGEKTVDRTVTGRFEPGQKDKFPLVTLNIPNRTTTAEITDKVRGNCLAVWFPKGSKGQVKFMAWPAKSGKSAGRVFSSDPA